MEVNKYIGVYVSYFRNTFLHLDLRPLLPKLFIPGYRESFEIFFKKTTQKMDAQFKLRVKRNVM